MPTNQEKKSTFNISGNIQSGITNVGGEQNFQNETKIEMGDQINLTGDFAGAILNITSKLDRIKQAIGTMPHGDKSTKDDLINLTDQLKNVLKQAAEDNIKEAEEVAKRLEELVNEVKEPKPNKKEVEVKSNKLKQAAENLAEALPIILTIATRIVVHIASFIQ